ncbi:MAG: hypothetical protein ACFCBW_10325 [Candidatus Competibacterales bacterium]
MEARCCDLDTPPDHPSRGPLWAQLARALHAAGETQDAPLCWSRALGDGPPHAAAWAEEWARQAPSPPSPGEPLTPDHGLGLAVRLIAAGANGRPPPASPERLQGWLDELPSLELRTLWLARQALAKAAGGDPVGLQRTREALLAQLQDGLPIAGQVPSFVLRWGDALRLPASAEARGQALAALHTRYGETERQISTIEADPAATDAYVALVFAWGRARLGQQTAVAELLAPREPTLEALEEDPLHRACIAAYRGAIAEQLAPRPPRQSQPNAPCQRHLAVLDPLQRYKAERLLAGSPLLRHLGPRGDPFWGFIQTVGGQPGGWGEDPLAGLAALEDQWREAPDEALDEAGWDPVAPVALAARLPPNRGQGPLAPWLERLPQLSPGTRLAALGALYPLADRWRRGDWLTLLAPLWPTPDTVDANALAGQLARCGPLLQRWGHNALGLELCAALESHTLDPQGQLAVAAARAALGDGADPVPASAWDALELELGQLSAANRLAALEVMALALGRSEATTAAAKTRRLLNRWLVATTDSLNTNSHFCLAVIRLVEYLTAALAPPELALSPPARAWIDADEAWLRRQLHGDP